MVKKTIFSLGRFFLRTVRALTSFSFLKRRARVVYEVAPEDILIDAQNLPALHEHTLEGRLDKPISKKTLHYTFFFVCAVSLFFFGRAVQLMALDGAHYRAQAEENSLERAVVFAERGIIRDRNGVELAYNSTATTSTATKSEEEVRRVYADIPGMGMVLGYVRAPARDAHGVWYRTTTEGVDGVEQAYDQLLSGENGVRLIETDVHQTPMGGQVVQDASSGLPLTLTIDSRVQNALYSFIQDLAEKTPFRGGAGVLMDVHTGELLALVSYPEYNPNALVAGDKGTLASYRTDERNPYLNRTVSGQFTPGSVVKPYMAVAALLEKVVTPETTFVSTGALRVENPYAEGTFEQFNDWRAQGEVDLRKALAVSSNVYFYYVGGGFGSQRGLGIRNIDTYMKRFGFGETTGSVFAQEAKGLVPSPEWKERVFPEDPVWRVGDTYHTAIGQYGFLVTPLQMVRAVASVANGGALLTPRIESTYTQREARDLAIDKGVMQVVQEGMRLGVLEGTAKGLHTPYLSVSAKTGTAEVGTGKSFVNSWVTGFFPSEKPRYAFVVVMEHGPRKNTVGATFVMRELLDWMHEHTPEYLSGENTSPTEG